MFSSDKFSTTGESMAACTTQGAHLCTKSELVSWKSAGNNKCQWGWFSEDMRQIQVCEKCEDGEVNSQDQEAEGAVECETGIKTKLITPATKVDSPTFCCNDISEEQLISKGKRAWQSSTEGDRTADEALDGDASTFSETKSEKSWWEVDLGKDYLVTRVHVTARTDCCFENINPFYVMVHGSI